MSPCLRKTMVYRSSAFRTGIAGRMRHPSGATPAGNEIGLCRCCVARPTLRRLSCGKDAAEARAALL